MGSTNRRDFLLLRVAADREIELSCEQLYMRFVDAQVDGSVSRLFATLADDLSRVTAVRLVDRSWLSSAELKKGLDERSCRSPGAAAGFFDLISSEVTERKLRSRTETLVQHGETRKRRTGSSI